ncbi:S1 family peptidase [Paenibacillus pasadenensis]|uniref:S1 family peptidase n=1 Tax=Paenibacillus pasadenensis TaxID=217090 RepID=UPI00203E5926|nr:S1 family peptidase [Paenibacillus pasadenensis]MCM3750249.1 S1 family peptidase [Paenibacillus pasadenensis]
MKKRIMFLSALLSLSLLSSGVSAESSSNLLSANESILNQVNKEKELLEGLDPYLQELRSLGNLYFDDSVSSFKINNPNDKKLVFSYSSDLENSNQINALIDKIKYEFPENIIEFRVSNEKSFPSDTLLEINKDIFDNLEFYNSLHANITSTFTDEEIGRVIIESTNLSQKAKDLILDRYGEIIEFRVSNEFQGGVNTVSRNGNNSLIGGGIAINNNSCTIAATAKKGADRYIITAEHCLSSANGTTSVNQNTSKVGVEWAKAGNGQDIGLIKITETGRQISNGVIKTSTSSYDGSFTSTSTVTQGQSVCKSGITTGYTCSTVLSTSFNPVVSGVNRPDQIKIANPNYQFQDSGDSGAPLFSSNALYGVMSGKSSLSGNDAWASATKIGTFATYWPDYTLFLYGIPF